MIEYELFYLVGESREHDLDKIKKEVEGVVSKEGGKILDVEVVTRRKMSYEIKKETRGVYVTKRFEVLDRDEREEENLPDKDIVAGINMKLLQNRDILRFLITRADQLPALGAEIVKNEKPKQEEKVFKKEEIKKEEVKEEAKKEEKVAQIKEDDKIEEEKPAKEKKKKEKKEKAEEDIDKKLDEILNI
jgi:ribosomal protein S6